MSWAGKLTKRDGKHVECPHRHKTRAAAEKCAATMRKEKPGNCQNYAPVEIVLLTRPEAEEMGLRW